MGTSFFIMRTLYYMIMDKEIMALGIEKSFRADETIFEAGSEAEGFYYLLSGEVRIFKMDEAGMEVEIAR
ncbi:MAG: cyclic nucleotide-binding domain-containing protein, partial [Candidatus Margulisbacteria bacterium]|nr:cyclic nucleotide-binding domain-containing protein [Candidatus Margulisiibacteriota bacterium]